MRRGGVSLAVVTACIAGSVRSLGCAISDSATKSAFVDTDGDGICDTDETVLHGTSPLLADTDGDGMSDYEEIVLHSFNPMSNPLRFNPRVADVPLMTVRVTGPPLISLTLTATDGETWSYETAQTIDENITVSLSTSEQDSFSSTFGNSESIDSQVTVEFRDEPLAAPANAQNAPDLVPEALANDLPLPVALDPGGPDAIVLTNGITSTVDRSNTQGVTLSFTAQQTWGLRRALTFAQAYSRSHTLSASGGVLEVLVEIANRGNVAFPISNLVLSASLVTAGGVEVPLGNLDINTRLFAYNPYSLLPGAQHGPVNFSRDLLTLEQVEALALNAQGLKLRVGVFELADADGKSYVFDSQTTFARTATVDIDYGDERPRERHLVATNLDSALPGVTMRRVFDEILRIPFSSDPKMGLTSVRNIPAESDSWTVELLHREFGEPFVTALSPPYEFLGILLRAGDVIHLRRAAR